MTILDRYIVRNLAAGFALLALILVSLFSLLALVDQLGDVGRGSYGVGDALIHVALTAPRRLVELLPFIALLGSLLALGWLAERNEFVAMRASGIPRARSAGASLGATLALIVLGLLIAQFVAPRLDNIARTRHTLAVSGPIALSTGHGFWSHSKRRFIHIGKVEHGRAPADIDIYRFDADGKLVRYIHAASARIEPGGAWRLSQVVRKKAGANGTLRTRHLRHLAWESFLSKKQVGVLIVPPQTLSLSDLYYYVQGLKGQRQNARRYSLAFWQKAALPVTVCAMVMIALPFVFGSRRSLGTGARLMLGAMVGVVFYIANQASARAGLLFGVDPAFAAFAPTVVLLVIALFLLRERK
jgi:lipopolysaccharide export system permease protein